MAGQRPPRGYDLLPGVPLITFGIECDFVLAFHESLLKPHIEKKGLEIVKNLTHWQKREINPADSNYRGPGRLEYMSWALRGNYPEHLYYEMFRDRSATYIRPNLRRYWEEPVLIGRDILKDVTDVNIVIEKYQKLTRFNRWSMMNDYSVAGYFRNRLMNKFRNRIPLGQEEN